MNNEYTFVASDGEKLIITTFLNEHFFSGDSLIFVHGFKGFKDWGFVPYLSDYFSKKGFFVVTFNFSYNGIGKDLTDFTELDKFAKNTYSREVRELNELISALRSNYFDIGSKGKLGLIGHSRGGAISLLATSKRNDVDAVSVWASIAKLNRYSKRQKVDWRKRGYFEVLNTRTNQMMRLDIYILDDIEKNLKSSLNLEIAVRNLNRPLLVAHGDQDLAVPIEEAEQIYKWSDRSITEFFKLSGTGHTFDIVHPFAGSNHKFERLLDKTANFFINNFN